MSRCVFTHCRVRSNRFFHRSPPPSSSSPPTTLSAFVLSSIFRLPAEHFDCRITRTSKLCTPRGSWMAATAPLGSMRSAPRTTSLLVHFSPLAQLPLVERRQNITCQCWPHPRRPCSATKQNSPPCIVSRRQPNHTSKGWPFFCSWEAPAAPQ